MKTKEKLVQIYDEVLLFYSFSVKEFLIVHSNNLVSKNNPEAATRSVLCKKLFLEISQNSQENTCTRVSFLIKLQQA